MRQRIPLVHGGIYGLMGEVTTIIPGETPCFECIFPRYVEGKSPFPVLGATPAVVASLQVMEVIKLIVGFGKPLAGRMLYLDGETMDFNVVEMKRDPHCNICGSTLS